MESKALAITKVVYDAEYRGNKYKLHSQHIEEGNKGRIKHILDIRNNKDEVIHREEPPKYYKFKGYDRQLCKRVLVALKGTLDDTEADEVRIPVEVIHMELKGDGGRVRNFKMEVQHKETAKIVTLSERGLFLQSYVTPLKMDEEEAKQMTMKYVEDNE